MEKFKNRFLDLIEGITGIVNLDITSGVLVFLDDMDDEDQQKVFRHLYMSYGDDVGVLMEDVLNDALPSVVFDVTLNTWGLSEEHMELYSMCIEGREDGYSAYGTTIDMGIIISRDSSYTIPCHELIDGRRSYIVL